MAYSNRDQFWFGTEHVAGWFRTPLRGADVSPEAWSEGGVLLNGGGWQVTSRGSHKNYQWEWKRSTPYAYAQKMKSYFEGTYGRGLIYFIDPMVMDKNLFPAQWADPSIGIDGDGPSLVYGEEPVASDTPANTNGYPVTSATYDLGYIAAGWRGREDAVFLPVPEGYTLLLGAQYEATGSGGVFIRVSNGGTLAEVEPLPPVPLDGDLVSTFVTATSGVWVFVGKSTSGAATITLRGMTARLIKTAEFASGEGYGEGEYGGGPYGGVSPATSALVQGPWVGGMGHSGCRFTQAPSFEITGPLNGGQAGFAASFREVGSFAY